MVESVGWNSDPKILESMGSIRRTCKHSILKIGDEAGLEFVGSGSKKLNQSGSDSKILGPAGRELLILPDPGSDPKFFFSRVRVYI